MAVTHHLLWLALLTACGGSQTKADVFEDDLDDTDTKRATTSDAELLASAVDIEASVALEYDMPYTVSVDGVEVGAGRMWRTPGGDGDLIVSGTELQVTNQAGQTVTVREEHHFAAEAPYALARARVGDQTVNVRLPADAAVNVLALPSRVYEPDELRVGMWERNRVYDAESNTVTMETTVLRKLGWATLDGRRVRVLWLDHRSSDGRGASTVMLSNGIPAYWERDGVGLRLVGSTIDDH